MNPPPAPPSPKSRQTEHHTDAQTPPTPPDNSRRGQFMAAHPHRQRRHHAHPECRSTTQGPKRPH
ncbi:hypothetical protein I553_1638 [Mycobacterium xenopi 4042]|uniref:Uncharacterized protein n=1 Tax=Mycobacterium xenopi 4042 TaxID=1299334 RepID=X8CF83_MYCXE|nr:hypothetical protein I553_1638 [Mycobacterium xenopi 4042]